MARATQQNDETGQSAPDAKRDYEREAAILADDDVRKQEGQKVLADQLRQQAEADAPADALTSEQRQATRAANSAEGGGAWPVDLMQERYVNPAAPVVGFDVTGSYTSHTDEAKKETDARVSA
jgi:hypothetical protein